MCNIDLHSTGAFANFMKSTQYSSETYDYGILFNKFFIFLLFDEMLLLIEDVNFLTILACKIYMPLYNSTYVIK